MEGSEEAATCGSQRQEKRPQNSNKNSSATTVIYPNETKGQNGHIQYKREGGDPLIILLGGIPLIRAHAMGV